MYFMLEIAIFTRWKNKKLEDLLIDISRQDFVNYKIKVYTDQLFNIDKDIDIIWTKEKNISKKRNLAIKNCQTKYLFLVDDDNRIYNKSFIKNLFHFYKTIKDNKKIISPTIYWKNTNIIQSAGIKFCYILWKVIAKRKIKNNFQKVYWIWWNSLFGHIDTFKQASFDEKIWFIREDIDYSYSLREKWVSIYVVNEKINHMEREKNDLEKSFIQDETFLRKIKNRSIFVKKHANIIQKLIFFMFWYWVSLIFWYIKRWKYKKKLL